MANDKVNNAVQALYPGKIDGATSNVTSDPAPPPGVPVEGVPLDLFCPVLNQNGVLAGAVTLRIDPPPVDSSDDINVISFWLNEEEIKRTAVTPENRNKPFFFDVFQTDLRDNEINKILYKAHRHSGNCSKSTELWVLYSETLPAGNDVPEDDGDEHPYLELDFPPELGDPPRIGKEEVEKGVTLTVDYPYMKAYDRITLEIRRERFPFTVLPADVGEPVPLFIDPGMFQKVGSLDACPFSYTVVDQLLNATHKRRWSKISRADINLTRSALDKAILREVLNDDTDDPEIVDLDKIVGDSLLVVVPSKAGVHEKGDEVVAIYRSTQPDAQWELNGIFEESFGVVLPCIMKLEKTKVISGSEIKVTYQLKRDGEVIGESRVAEAKVTGTPPVDLKPEITSVTDSQGAEIEHNGGTVDPTVTLTGTATPSQQVEIFEDSTSKDKTPANAKGIWTYPIRLSGIGTRTFTAKADYGSGEVSDGRTFTLSNAHTPAITLVQDSQGQEIPDGKSTVYTTVKLSGTATPRLEVEVFNNGTSVGTAKVRANDGKWELEVKDLSRTTHRFTAKALYTPGAESTVRTVTVIEDAVPTIESVKGSPSGDDIPPGGTTVEKDVTLSGVAAKGQKVDVLDGTTSKGQPTADPGTGVWTLLVSALTVATHSFTAKALYGSGQTSTAWTLTVTAATAPTITSAKGSPSGADIPNCGTTVETSVTLSGVAAKGQKVDVLDGTTSKGQPTADPVTGIWTLLVTALSVAAHSFTAKALYGSNPVSDPPFIFRVNQELSIDQTTMILKGIDIRYAGWAKNGVDAQGSFAKREAQGGMPPYTYSSQDTRVATTNGPFTKSNCTSAKTTTITVTDKLGAKVSYNVTCSGVYQLIVSPAGAYDVAAAEAWMRSIPNKYSFDTAQLYFLLDTHIPQPMTDSWGPTIAFPPGGAWATRFSNNNFIKIIVPQSTQHRQVMVVTGID